MSDVQRGAPWWEMPLEATEAVQESRQVSDTWTGPVLDYVEHMLRVTAEDILTNALKIPLDRHDRSVQMRVINIIKKGDMFIKGPGWIDGKRSNVWIRKG